jgi:hypothetical protein
MKISDIFGFFLVGAALLSVVQANFELFKPFQNLISGNKEVEPHSSDPSTPAAFVPIPGRRRRSVTWKTPRPPKRHSADTTSNSAARNGEETTEHPSARNSGETTENPSSRNSEESSANPGSRNSEETTSNPASRNSEESTADPMNRNHKKGAAGKGDGKGENEKSKGRQYPWRTSTTRKKPY